MIYVKEILDEKDLPNTYKRNGKTCFFDSHREKCACFVNSTAEEFVRQKMIRFLVDDLECPKEYVHTEVPLLRYAGIKSKLRADIIVENFFEDNTSQPLLIVECKSENEEITSATFEQVAKYADLIGAKYIIHTNGIHLEAYVYSEETDDYKLLDKVPKYEEMQSGYSVIAADDYRYIRATMKQLANIELISKRDTELENYMIGEDTKDNLKSFIINLGECFLDETHRIPVISNSTFKVLEDIGVRYMDYGNAGGGNFPGYYRSLIVEDSKGNDQIVSFAVSSYGKSDGTAESKEVRKGTSVLIVAIDDYDKRHNSLQLCIDTFAEPNEGDITIWHNGRISIGNIGSGKADELKELLKKSYPELLKDDRILLGTIKNNRLFYMDDQDIINLIICLIKYALVRDDYRSFKKASFKT